MAGAHHDPPPSGLIGLPGGPLRMRRRCRHEIHHAGRNARHHRHVLALHPGRLIMCALFLAARRRMPSWPATRFHALRSVAQVLSAVGFFYALTQIALAEAVVLGFTAALMIAPVARIVLGERISRTTLIASLVGFSGAASRLPPRRPAHRPAATALSVSRPSSPERCSMPSISCSCGCAAGKKTASPSSRS